MLLLGFAGCILARNQKNAKVVPLVHINRCHGHVPPSLDGNTHTLLFLLFTWSTLPCELPSQFSKIFFTHLYFTFRWSLFACHWTSCLGHSRPFLLVLSKSFFPSQLIPFKADKSDQQKRIILSCIIVPRKGHTAPQLQRNTSPSTESTFWKYCRTV